VHAKKDPISEESRKLKPSEWSSDSKKWHVHEVRSPLKELLRSSEGQPTITAGKTKTKIMIEQIPACDKVNDGKHHHNRNSSSQRCTHRRQRLN